MLIRDAEILQSGLTLSIRLGLRGIFCLLSIALSGCYPAYGPLMATFGGEDAPLLERTPQMRTGMLLFPALIWPLTIADPRDLGKHEYRLGPLPPMRIRETSWGIIYTRRAGFVDIAHIRNSIDLAYYAYPRLQAALKAEHTHVVLVGAEPSLYHLWISYPEWWKNLTSAAKAPLTALLGQRMAQRMSYMMMTWHEIITWYGYRSTLIAGEKWSAFSPDDMASHLLGAELSGPYLDLPEEQFEQAITQALSRRLTELEAQEPAQTRKAVDMVEGYWWDFRKQDLLRRQVEIHLDGEAMSPWLVPALANGGQAATLSVATLGDVNGYDCREMIRVEIIPNVLEAYAIRSDLQTSAPAIYPEQDFNRLAAHIRNAEAAVAQP